LAHAGPRGADGSTHRPARPETLRSLVKCPSDRSLREAAEPEKHPPEGCDGDLGDLLRRIDFVSRDSLPTETRALFDRRYRHVDHDLGDGPGLPSLRLAQPL